jgi:hypothetical protein
MGDPWFVFQPFVAAEDDLNSQEELVFLNKHGMVNHRTKRPIKRLTAKQKAYSSAILTASTIQDRVSQYTLSNKMCVIVIHIGTWTALCYMEMADT